MPKSYSGDLRERAIEVVEMEGASRREAAELLGVAVSNAEGLFGVAAAGLEIEEPLGAPFIAGLRRRNQ